MNKSPYIDHKLEDLRTRIYIFIGIFLLTGGIVYYKVFIKGIEGLFGGAAIILAIAALLLFSVEGIQLDIHKKRFRYYLHVLFLKIGIWKSWETYTDLILLRSKTRSSVMTDQGYVLERASTAVYEIYMASPNHFDLILLKKVLSKHKAEQDVDRLAVQMKLPWIQYNPGRRRPREVLGGLDHKMNAPLNSTKHHETTYNH